MTYCEKPEGFWNGVHNPENYISPEGFKLTITLTHADLTMILEFAAREAQERNFTEHAGLDECDAGYYADLIFKLILKRQSSNLPRIDGADIEIY